MRIGIIGLLLAVLVVFSACKKERISGDGPVITEVRDLTGFTRIASVGSTNVSVHKGPNFKVEVKGFNNLLPYFETRVANGLLTVGYKEYVNVRNDNIEVTVTVPVLDGLLIEGSGDITSDGDFTGNTNLATTIVGSGDITINKGAADNFSADISGSGSINAFGFTAKNATIHVSGSGETRITATDQLKVKISGSGNVYYKGSPAVSTTINGSGAVIQQ